MVNFKFLGFEIANISSLNLKYMMFLLVAFSNERAKRSYLEEFLSMVPRTLNNPIEVSSGLICVKNRS